MTGALKVRTSTSPDVWTVMGGGSFATEAETIAGELDDRAVTPAGLNAALDEVDPRTYGFATTATGAVNSAALQAAINDAMTATDPVTTTRTANRRVVIPAGIYLLDSPITIRSVIGLEIIGHGYCELRANTNMTSLFDINGMAYSRFGGLTITGTSGVQVDQAIYTYFDAAGASRTNTRNSFHDIAIRNLNYVAGIRVGLLGSNAQVDNDEYRNLSITGTWASGDTTRYQYGIYFGTGVSANNVTHHAYKLTLSHNRYNIRVDATQLAVYGAGFDGAETDLNITSVGYFYISGVRGENSERLLTTSTTTAATNMTLADVSWSADSMNADGNWMRFQHGGVLVLSQVKCRNPAVQPKIVAGAGVTPAWVIADGLSIGGSPGSYPIAACFTLTASARAVVNGYTSIGSGGTTVSIENYDSATAAASPEVWAGAGPTMNGRTGDYWASPVAKSTLVTVAGTMYLHAVWVPVNCTLDRISAQPTVGAVGSTITLGIYEDNGFGDPGALLLDAGTIDGNVVAASEITISRSLIGNRLYHIAALVQGGVPTMRSLSGTWTGRNTTATNAMGAAVRAGRTLSGVSGTALPNPAGGTGLSTTVPAIAVRFA